MNITITTPKFRLEDGREFNTRKEAEEAQAAAVRISKLNALFVTAEDQRGLVSIEAIAENHEAVIAALTNPLGKGRKPKATEAPAS